MVDAQDPDHLRPAQGARKVAGRWQEGVQVVDPRIQISRVRYREMDRTEKGTGKWWTGGQVVDAQETYLLSVIQGGG